MIYRAKSEDENGDVITVKKHCDDVSKVAGKYAEAFGQKRRGELCGLYHDFGKYSERFQDVLRKKRTGIDHAACGAVYLSRKKNKDVPITEAINGHHDGLRPFNYIKDYARECYSSNEPQYINENKDKKRKACALAGREEFKAAANAFKADHPGMEKMEELEKLSYNGEYGKEQYNTESMLFTRMLFSCLVDADYTVSGGGDISHDNGIDAVSLLARLDEFMKKLRESSKAPSSVNEMRNTLFDRCGEVGEKGPSGLYTLTAPTGMGKTMALLNFALRHCASHPEKKRIIMVLPFLSLTEQTANAYKSIIPEILEDHSQSKISEENREFASKWDSPFIITTSVKFFEALFADQPTDCRKLHNISESVIIFDEAQSLPADLTRSTLISVNELCERYKCTVVFSTATQPDYSAIQNIKWEPEEIFPENPEYFERLRRTEVVWDLKMKTELSEIAEEMSRTDNVCAIVNMRKHALKLYEQLSALCDEGVYHISSDLCPQHRCDIVGEIKRRQSEGLPCRVVSTQCIEAGVDLDFDLVYRALAPLEAIIQAAGRCNRNGKMTKCGRVIVFEPNEPGRIYPERWYERASDAVKNILEDCDYRLDIHDPANITKYYRRIFKNQSEKALLTDAICDRDYEKTAREYKLITQSGFRVLVPYDLELYGRLKAEALENGINNKWLREAAPITVSTFEDLGSGAFPVERLYYRKNGRKSDRLSDVFVLNTGKEDLYDRKTGLQLRKPDSEDFIS